MEMIKQTTIPLYYLLAVQKHFTNTNATISPNDVMLLKLPPELLSMVIQHCMDFQPVFPLNRQVETMPLLRAYPQLSAECWAAFRRTRTLRLRLNIEKDLSDFLEWIKPAPSNVTVHLSHFEVEAWTYFSSSQYEYGFRKTLFSFQVDRRRDEITMSEVEGDVHLDTPETGIWGYHVGSLNRKPICFGPQVDIKGYLARQNRVRTKSYLTAQELEEIVGFLKPSLDFWAVKSEAVKNLNAPLPRKDVYLNGQEFPARMGARKTVYWAWPITEILDTSDQESRGRCVVS